MFKLPPERIRLHAPDVGGGFGTKNFLYPEWILLLWAARKLGRPVRWEADRAEEFVSSAQGRDIAAKARLGLDKDGRFLALDIEMVANHRRLSLGQRAGRGGGRGLDRAWRRLRHPGDRGRRARRLHQHRAGRCLSRRRQARGQLHHRALHRGGGAQLGRDPADAAAAEPDRVLPAQDRDGHDHRFRRLRRQSRSRRRARRVAAFEARRAEARARGKLRGLGVACFLETSRGAPNEGAEVRFETDGTVTVAVGTELNGQGHETAYAQIAADRLGVPMPGDPLRAGRHPRGEERRGPWRRALDAHGRRGGGQGDRRRARPRARLAARLLQASEGELVLEAGAFAVRGSGRRIELLSVRAKAARRVSAST